MEYIYIFGTLMKSMFVCGCISFFILYKCNFGALNVNN